MSAPQKFMFDNSFDKGHEKIDPLEELKAKFQEKIAKTKSESFEEGKQAGHQEALETIENQAKTAIEALNTQQQNLLDAYHESIKQLEAKMIEFGITAGSKIANELITQQPMELLENFFKEAFQNIVDVPEVIATVNPAVKDQIISQCETWKQQSGFKGEISFQEDESLGISDAAIKWKEGGIQRSVNELMNAINSAMTNYFSSRNGEIAVSPQQNLPVEPSTKVSVQND